MRNIRLTLAYDGTNYVGWQVQPNGLSVQEVVERAVFRLTGEDVVHVLAAGRTDAGVHALGQVASFRTECRLPCERIRAALQSRLPEDIVVRDVQEAGPSFHATYSAVRKRYRYVIDDHPLRDPLLRRYVWHHRSRLDADAMQAAARELLGTHDFRCFESHFPNKASSVRTVMEAAVIRCGGWPVWNPSGPPLQPDPGDGRFVCFDIVADGFLYNMVRAIVGTLVKIGRGKWTPDDMRRIIAARDRAQAGETAPPHGLYLVQVEYG